VVLRRKIEARRLAPAPHLAILGFVFTDFHARVRQVRKREHELIEARFDPGQRPFALADRLAHLLAFAHERGRVAAAFLELADLARELVFLFLHLLEIVPQESHIQHSYSFYDSSKAFSICSTTGSRPAQEMPTTSKRASRCCSFLSARKYCAACIIFSCLRNSTASKRV